MEPLVAEVEVVGIQVAVVVVMDFVEIKNLRREENMKNCLKSLSI